MNQVEINELLKNTGVIMEGHFLLTSGRHSAQFLQCSQLLQHPEHTARVCRMLAEPFINRGIETVIGPAMGGVILSYETARALKARAIYAEPDQGKMTLRRGFRIRPGEKVLVVEDAVTTGGSVQKVLKILRAGGVEAAGVSVLVDRSVGKVDFGVFTHALLAVEIESYDPACCPLCLDGVPLQKPKA